MCLLPVAALTMFLASAQPVLPDLAEYKDLTVSGSEIPVLFENFDEELPGWKLGSKTVLAPRAGMTGTGALFMERTNPGDFQAANAELPLKLKKGRYYRVSVYHRSEVKKLGYGYSVMIKITQKRPGQPDLSICPNGKVISGDQWKKVEMSFLASDNNKLSLYLFWDAAGKAWFDNVRIEELGGNKGTVYPVYPASLRMDDEGKIKFKGYVWEIPPEKISDHAVLVELNGKRKLCKLNGSDAEVSFGALKPGKYPVKSWLLCTKNKSIVAKDQFTVIRTAAVGVPENYWTIDRYGRFISDGKPVLPIGIFANMLRTEMDLQRIAAGRFNFVLDYASPKLNIQIRENEISRRPREGTAKNINTPEWKKQIFSSLELFKKHNLKLVSTSSNQVFHNSTVLGFYIADERPATMLPRLRKMREEISFRDPFHPIIALTDKPEDYIGYAKICDILGVDPYPILNRESKNMNSVRHAIREAKKTGIPIMFVPQAFNWGAFKKEPYSHFAYPSAQQMRSMVLLAAAYDIKMFCFYTYTQIFEEQEQKDPGSSKKFWPDVVSVSSLLAELAPWILSLEKAPDVTVKSLGKPAVDVKAMQFNGKVRVIITACGPGKAEAVITVSGRKNLHSRFGKTLNSGNGTYIFKGQDIDSDILEER